MLVPAFTGSTTFRVALPVSFDMEVASAKYLYGLSDGEVPLAFNFNGTVHYRGDDGRPQLSLVPWSCSAEYRFPVSIWRELIVHYYPHGVGARAGGYVAGPPAREGRRGCLHWTRAWRSSCEERSPSDERAGRHPPLRGLCALSLHTGATKNAT